jgi:AP-1 complex subunit mu
LVIHRSLKSRYSKNISKREANKLFKEERLTVKVPIASSNVVSWRTEGIKHSKNEVLPDVIEILNLLVLVNGNVLRSEIIGNVRMKSLVRHDRTQARPQR